MREKMRQLTSLVITDRKPRTRAEREYLRGAVLGALLYFGFFLYCLVAHYGFSLMGVSDPELTRLAKVYLMRPLIWFELKVLLAYLLIGAGLGLFFGAILQGLQNLTGHKFGRFHSWTILLSLLLLFHVLIFARAIVLYPQLFTEFMYEQGGAWKELMILLTDRVGPWPMVIALWTMTGAGILIWMVAVFRNWKGRGREVLRGRLKIAGLSAAAAIIFGSLLFLWPVPHGNHGPNLLIIGADSIRPDLLSAYGYSRPTSPALDALAKKGVRFEQVYSQLPRTFPAWVNIFTGRYPFQHGITSMFPTVADRQKDFHALPEILRDRGWATAVVADYAGDIFPRIDLGFERVDAPNFGFPTLGQMRGLEIHTHLLPYLANPWGREIFPVLQEFAGLGNPAFVEREVDRRLKSLAGKDRFLLTVFFSATHFPYSPPWPYYQAFSRPGYRGLSKYNKFNRINVAEKLAPEDTLQARAIFDGAILATDHAIGEILNALQRHDLDQNTVIVFLADHGENLYEHEYLMGHGDHLRGRYSLKMPLIIYDPRRKFAVTAVEPRVRSIDLFPTFLELMGLTAPPDLPAVSLVPLMEGKGGDPDLPVYTETGLWFIHDGPGFFQKERIKYPDVTRICWFEEFFNYEIVQRDEWKGLTETAKDRMLIKGRWKIIYCPLPDGVKYELYDLAADPEERRDLAAEKPAELAAMKAELRKVLALRPGWTFAGDYFVPERSEDELR